MNKHQLETQFEILKNDVSGLVDTNYYSRLARKEDGRYYLKSYGSISGNASRVRRVLGAICPDWNLNSIKAAIQNIITRSLPEGYPEIERVVIEEQRQCVTTNWFILRLLLLLRLDGVLDFGATHLCGDGDPVEYLKKIINGSSIENKDTMLALLDVALNDEQQAFILDDPEELPGEKLDKAIMLLSLLSKEDILEYGGRETVSGKDTQGIFCSFFPQERYIAKVLPLVMTGCPKALDIFKNALKRGCQDENQQASILAESLSDFFAENDSLQSIAFDRIPYRNIILQCANAGESISDWVRNASVCLDDNTCDVNTWVLEHIDSQVSHTIMNRKGYYMLSLADSDIVRFESSEEYKSLRKYIVDNGFLLDVWHSCFDYGEFCVNLAFYKIDTKTRNNGYVRFYNFDNLCLDEEHSYLEDILKGFDPKTSNQVFRFISIDKIAEESYRLDMSLYNSHDFAISKNPVLLRDILTPVEGSIGVFEDKPYGPTYEDGSVEAHLLKDPLSNYREFRKAGLAYRSNGDKKYHINQAVFIRRTWPMQPTWISVKNTGPDGGIIVNERDSGVVRVYKIDQSLVYPWYLTYKLSNLTYQFNLRKNKEGDIDEAQFLRMHIDLPSLEEQQKEVEDVINKEIERKNRQIGSVETLFNLSHTIGLPASRIQSLLGNLQDMCMRNSELSSQIKKVTDNFDYILRVIKSTSKDFSSTNDILKEIRILPVLELFISSFSSLPFGIDPMINKSRIDIDTKVKIDNDIFFIMMDNILMNVYRHGFGKKCSIENKVLIELDIVQHEGAEHLMLSIRNNGRKLEDGFTVYDYISRGKCGRHTGNTGQGGYDIYQIVKKFNGYLGLRSDDQWNFIIDILIPVVGYDSEVLKKQYTYGTLL